MDESIKSGCKPLGIVKEETIAFDDGKIHSISFNISEEAERIAKEIYKQQNELVLTYLPTETLLKLKKQIEKELQKRKNML